MAPGILWVGSNIKNPDTLSEESFNKWYNDVHLQDVLDTGVPDFALRYKNLSGDRPFQNAAIYHIPDLEGLSKQEFQDIPKTSDLLGGSNDWRNELSTDIRVYELIQTFEGPNSASLGRAGGFISVFMTPAAGTDKEFDDWYRIQHLDMISMCRGYIRTTRYKVVQDSPFNKANAKQPLPSYLAIHEYATTEWPADQLKIVVGTEWSKKVISESTVFDRDTWAYGFELASKAAKAKEPRLGVV